MKKFLTSIFALLFVMNLSAQQASKVTADDPIVKKFTQTYDLNDTQVQNMIKIQERRIKNLTEIKTLRDTDTKTFHKKRDAINKGTQTSISMMLSPEQLNVFNKEKVSLRELKAKKTVELKESGLSYEAIQIALIDLEDELYK